jgi:hypothetical protein
MSRLRVRKFLCRHQCTASTVPSGMIVEGAEAISVEICASKRSLKTVCGRWDGGKWRRLNSHPSQGTPLVSHSLSWIRNPEYTVGYGEKGQYKAKWWGRETWSWMCGLIGVKHISFISTSQQPSARCLILGVRGIMGWVFLPASLTLVRWIYTGKVVGLFLERTALGIGGFSGL